MIEFCPFCETKLFYLKYSKVEELFCNNQNCLTRFYFKIYRRNKDKVESSFFIGTNKAYYSFKYFSISNNYDLLLSCDDLSENNYLSMLKLKTFDKMKSFIDNFKLLS